MTTISPPLIHYAVFETTEHHVSVDPSKLPHRYDVDTDPEGRLDQLIADECSTKTNDSFVCVHNRKVTRAEDNDTADPAPTTSEHDAEEILRTLWSILGGSGSSVEKVDSLEEFLPHPNRISLAHMSLGQRQKSMWMQAHCGTQTAIITGLDGDTREAMLTFLNTGETTTRPFSEVIPDPDLPRMTLGHRVRPNRPAGSTKKPLTLGDLIAELGKVPDEKRNLPIYLCNLENPDLQEVVGVSTWNTDAPHSEGNPLSIDTSTSDIDW